jgi:hypothetical protein
MKSLLTAALLVGAMATATPVLAQMMSASQIVGSIGSSEFLESAMRVSSASSARVVRISTFMGASRAGDRMASSRSTYSSDLDYLHSNLVQSPTAMHAIRSSGFSVDDIVALTVDSSGAAILYADDL